MSKQSDQALPLSQPIARSTQFAERHSTGLSTVSSGVLVEQNQRLTQTIIELEKKLSETADLLSDTRRLALESLASAQIETAGVERTGFRGNRDQSLRRSYLATKASDDVPTQLANLRSRARQMQYTGHGNDDSTLQAQGDCANADIPSPPLSLPSYLSSYLSSDLNILQSPSGIPRPSRYCLDVIELEGMVRQLLITQESKPVAKRQSLDTLVQKMLLLLISDNYWIWTKTWYTETQGLEKVGPITRYRIAPTIENYCKLQPQFRPTELQMTTFHWPLVDWIPFPGIRDRYIMHAHEYDLTDVITTSMASYCLEAEIEDATYDENGSEMDTMDTGVEAPPRTHRKMVYYRLSEYIEHITRSTTSTPSDVSPSSRTTTMSSTLEAKFVLALREVVTHYKLERTFFERFPALYCEEAVARGEYRSIFDPY